MLIESIWDGIKTGSLACAFVASGCFWLIGLGVTIDLLTGSTPVVCVK